MHVMQGIQVLNLSGNGLESVPPFVYSLPNLQKLHLQNNCIMGKKLRVNCFETSILKVFAIIVACINFEFKKKWQFLRENMNVSLLFVPVIEVSRLEDIDGLGHVNLQNNPISDDLKSQLQSCKFTVLLGNDAVS